MNTRLPVFKISLSLIVATFFAACDNQSKSPGPIQDDVSILNTLRSSRIDYFRAGTSPPFGTMAENVKIVLKNGRLPLDKRTRKAYITATQQIKETNTELLRPWAGGYLCYLVAFEDGDKPLFSISMQTTTPNEFYIAREDTCIENRILRDTKNEKETEDSPLWWIDSSALGAFWFAAYTQLMAEEEE